MESTTATATAASSSALLKCLSGLGAVVFDVGALWEHLAKLSDSRHKRGVRYQLAALLLLIVLAKLANQDQPSAIADWAAGRKSELLLILGLIWARMPHHNTFRRILQWAVQPEELDRSVGEFLRGLPGSNRSVLVAIDGKTVRGTIGREHSRGQHLLAAYLPEEGLVLMQVEAGQKENEITVAPTLLGCLDLRGKIVAGDAMHTQREISVQILAGGGDYLWIAKDNQPRLRADIERLFAPDRPTVLGGQVPDDFQAARTVDKGHGRLETRQITVSSLLQGVSDWPGVKQVFRLERSRLVCQTGRLTQEVIYGLTSLSREEASASRLLYLIRTYWGIENGLHHRRDVTFDEDRTRLTRGNAGRVMASINNLVIGILRHAGATNLAQARRHHDTHFTKAITLLAANSV